MSDLLSREMSVSLLRLELSYHFIEAARVVLGRSLHLKAILDKNQGPLTDAETIDLVRTAGEIAATTLVRNYDEYGL